MKKIRISLEYGCFPVWIYDKNNQLVDNDLPSELIGERDIDPSFVRIQEIFDSLFLNDKKEFKYVGFKEDDQRESFLRDISSTIELLRSKLSDEYVVEVDMSKIRAAVD